MADSTSWSEPFRYRHHKNKAKRPRYNHHPSPSQIFSDCVKSAASAQFEKRFPFSEESSWILPEPSEMFIDGQTQDINSELLQMKIKLNDVKNSLSDKEIREWHTHTTSLHCGGKTMQHLRQHYRVELCTQAWCKFHEILTFYPVIPVQTSGCLNSVHLCEAPGAFITSLNQFIKSRPEYMYLQWKWIGTTLNPYYEGNSLDSMIADDRFIQDTMPNWFFGIDDSGDLMNRQNLDGLYDRAQSEMGQVHLVTADGSINCQNDPGEQETFVSQLHYCEMITALYLLTVGGSFVIKMFTMFELCTANMMYLLNCSFEEVHVFKPSTSKAGNSEVYVICLNYKGRSRLDDYFPVLLQAFSPDTADSPLFPSLPSSFVSKLIECCHFFKSHQLKAITNNLSLYENMTYDDRQYAEDVRDCCTQMFVEKCRIQMLQKKRKILRNNLVSSSNIKSSMYFKTLEQRLQGTFNERVQKQQLSWHQKMLGLKQEISKLEEQLVGVAMVSELQNTRELSEKDICNWDETYGREVQQVLNSPFCSSHVVGHWLEAHANAKVTENTSEEYLITSEIESCIVSSLETLLKISRNSPLECLCLSPTNALNPVLKILKDNGCIMVYNSERTNIEEEEKMDKEDGNKEEEDKMDKEDGNKEEEDKMDKEDGNKEEEDKMDKEDQHALAKPYKSKVHVCCSFASLQSPDNEESCKVELLANVVTALKSICIGGCVIVQVRSLLTRFNAGLLYILYKVFSTVYLCDLGSKSSFSSSCLLICHDYRGCHGSLLSYLTKLHDCMVSTSETGQTLLQILPMSELYEREFEQELTHFNETCLMRQVVAIVNYEMADDTDDMRASSQESGAR